MWGRKLEGQENKDRSAQLKQRILGFLGSALAQNVQLHHCQMWAPQVLALPKFCRFRLDPPLAAAFAWYSTPVSKQVGAQEGLEGTMYELNASSKTELKTHSVSFPAFLFTILSSSIMSDDFEWILLSTIIQPRSTSTVEALSTKWGHLHVFFSSGQKMDCVALSEDIFSWVLSVEVVKLIDLVEEIKTFSLAFKLPIPKKVVGSQRDTLEHRELSFDATLWHNSLLIQEQCQFLSEHPCLSPLLLLAAWYQQLVRSWHRDLLWRELRLLWVCTWALS